MTPYRVSGHYTFSAPPCRMFSPRPSFVSYRVVWCHSPLALTRGGTPQRGRRPHAARVAGRGAAGARRRRVPAAGRRRARPPAAGRRQGAAAQGSPERQRRRLGLVVGAVHARVRGARGRRARARRHAASALQWRSRSFGPRLGPGGRGGGVARLVRGRGGRAGGGGRGRGCAARARRRRRRRATVRHQDSHAHLYFMVERRERRVPVEPRRGRGGGDGAGAGAPAPPLHRRRRQAAPLGPAHDGVYLQGVVGARGGRDVSGAGPGHARGETRHRIEGPLRAHAGHAARGHWRVGGQQPQAAGAAALRRRAGAGAGRRRALQRLARHQPQALGPRHQHAHAQRNERPQGLGDGRVPAGRGRCGCG